MKRLLPLALMVLAAGAHAKDILLSCEMRFGDGEDATRATYRIFDNGTKVQMGHYGDIARVTTTPTTYTWSWSFTSNDGVITKYNDVLDRHSGNISVYEAGTKVATGTCELTKPKF